MKRTVGKWMLAAVLCLGLLTAAFGAHAAEITYGDLIRFIPAVITVEEDAVVVKGYFVNLNTDVKVSDFYNYSMAVYMEDALLVEGEFGEINSFTIQPLGAVYQSFTFTGSHDLNVGEYVCSDNTYAVVTCEFYYEED